MIDVLGFHHDRDYQADLAALQTDTNALTSKVTDGRFHSYEDRHNTYGRLTDLTSHARGLRAEAAMVDQRLRRLADAARTTGDTSLAFIAYVAFGPQALPMQPLYEVRLLDQHGYTVPGTIRKNLPADRLTRTGKQLVTVNGPEYARLHGHRWNPSHHRIQITPF